MNQTVWKYESGDTKSIFGRPYTYNGTKWVPDEGGQKKEEPKKDENDFSSFHENQKVIREAEDVLKRNGKDALTYEYLHGYQVDALLKANGKTIEDFPKKEDWKAFLNWKYLGGKKPKTPEEKSTKFSASSGSKTYNELSNKYTSKINSDSQQSLMMYAEHSDDINSFLRRGQRGGRYDEKEDIKKMDKAFKEVPPLEKDTEVFRIAVVDKKDLDKFTPGSIYQDNAFVSTSINKKVMGEFLDKNNEELPDTHTSVQLNILCKKGGKAIPISEINSEYENAHEQELLLNRGSKFRVEKVTTAKGLTVVSMVML